MSRSVVRYRSVRPHQEVLRERVKELAAAPTTPNEAWAMDFIHDTLADGRTIRVLTAIDVFTRECVAHEASPTFRGSDVARILGSAGAERGLPGRIRVDHGTEFTSKALDHWAYWNRVELDFIRPGKPTDNPFIEAFNATLRRECLSQHCRRGPNPPMRIY